MNIYEAEFDILEVGNLGMFTSENRKNYEALVRIRSANGWRMCQCSLVTIPSHCQGDPYPALYITWQRKVRI